MKAVYFLILSLVLSVSPGISQAQGGGNGDSALWKLAKHFSALMAAGDTGSLARLLPGDFMIQLSHENFLGKSSLLRSISDTNVLKVLAFYPDQTGNFLIRYSDDGQAACLNASMRFIDKETNEMLTRGNGYGLSIFYFRKGEQGWQLQTVHIDVHCNSCDF